MYELNAEVREAKITKASRNALRRTNRVPCVMYDHNSKAVNMSLDKKDTQTLIRKRGTSGLVQLNLKDGEKVESHEVVFKNLQYNYLQNDILHLDFQRTEPGVAVKIKVPVKGAGVPFGVLRQGGVLQQSALDVEMVCMAANIPDYISIDISKLKLNEVIRAKDIPGYTFTMPNLTIFTCATSRAARKLDAASGDAVAAETSED